MRGKQGTSTAAAIRPSWFYTVLLLTVPVLLLAPGLSPERTVVAILFVIAAARVQFAMRIVATNTEVVVYGFWRRQSFERSRVCHLKFRQDAAGTQSGSLYLFVDRFEPVHLRLYGMQTSNPSAFANHANSLLQINDAQSIRTAELATSFLRATAAEKLDHYRNASAALCGVVYGCLQLAEPTQFDSQAPAIALIGVGAGAAVHQIAKLVPLLSWEASGGADAIRELDDRNARTPQGTHR
jgi:hypothetical protein